LENKNNIELVKIYENSRLWSFFLFTLTAYHILLFQKKLYKPLIRSQFKSEKDFKDCTELQSRLNSLTDSMLLVNLDDEQKSFSELSVNDILYFLILVDSVAKYLLSLDDINLALIEEVSLVTGVNSNWEKFFFIEAQLVFDEMKIAFKTYPNIIDAILNQKGQ